MDQDRFSLLSRLWLKEADDATLVEVEKLPCLADQAASSEALAAAYADIFLLNVYPYASVFLDPNGEMNGLRSRELSALFQQFGYQPVALFEVGAPDHIGLALGFLAQLEQTQRGRVLGEYILDWAPVLCFAIERQSNVHPFYRKLAACTRQELFQAFESSELAAQRAIVSQRTFTEKCLIDDEAIELTLVESEEELSLSQVIQTLLTPARSGIFLSRAQLGRWALKLGIPLAFGERYRLGLSLFEAAGIAEAIPQLFDLLLVELGAWDSAYKTWTEQFPAWKLIGGKWRRRIASTQNFLEKAQVSFPSLKL